MNNMRCRHGWLDHNQCETCVLFAENERLKSALQYYADRDSTIGPAFDILNELRNKRIAASFGNAGESPR
jgi:hypothetical protein